MTLYAFEGRTPQVAASAYVAPSAQVIGRVVIGADCYVGHGAILRGDYGTILVGDGTAVEDGVIVHARPEDTTRIGKRVTLGHGAMIHNATIHDEAVIGMRATVSDFAVVGTGALIGEMGLVKQRQEVPPGKVAVGIPVRVIEDVSARNRDQTVWSKELYVDLAHRYPAGLVELPEHGSLTGPMPPWRPIGIVRTPFATPEGTPIQGAWAPEAKGTIELDAQFAAGLEDLDGFSHVVVVYAFHRSSGYALKVRPYLDVEERGLFATRAPRRPCPIGLTVVRLDAVVGNRLEVTGVDMLDGTPVLDLKPYLPGLDPQGEVRWGWLEARQREADERGETLRRTADGRFHGDEARPPAATEDD